MSGIKTKVNDRQKALAAAAPLLTNHWRTVLKKLGVTQTQIQDVVNLHRHKRPDEVVYQALLKWQELYMGEATLDDLVNVLVDMNLVEIADKIKKYQKPKPKPVPKPTPRQTPVVEKKQKTPQHSFRGDAMDFIESLEHIDLANIPVPDWRSRRVDLSHMIDLSVLEPKYQPGPASIDVPTREIPGVFGSIVPLVRSADSSVRTTPRSSRGKEMIPPMLSYSEIATPVSIETLQGLEEPPEEEKPMKIFDYNYIASLVSPIQQFKREPRYGGICFLQNSDVVLLDRANSQIEIHECHRIFDGKRFVFRKVFKVSQGRNSKLGSIAVYENVIIVLDIGERCLRFFTSKGQEAGYVRFRHQPLCIALRHSRAVIAFWNTNINKGSIVTYRVNITTDKKGQKTFSLFLPNPIAGVTNKYSEVALTDNHDVVAISDDGRLFLFGFKSQLSATYVCHSVAENTDLRCLRCSKDSVLVCNSYRDTLTQIPVKGDDSARSFDIKNSRPILNEEDGINGVTAFAVFKEDNDIAVVNNFGSKVYMYGNRKIQYKE